MTESASLPVPPRLSLLQRMIGVLTSPGETFRSIAAHPTWFGVLAVQLVVTAAAFAIFLSTDVGKAAYVDQSVSSIESFGQTVSDEMYEGIRRQAEYARIIQPATIVLLGPLFTAILAAIFYGVFAVLGGESTFRHVFSVVTHAGVVTMLQPLFTLPLNYQRQTMSSATNLSVFLPMLEEGSFLASLLGVLDLFYIWYAVVLAIGLAVIYRRRTTPIATGLLAVFVLIGVAVATLKVVLGGR
jgi:hypothetical protein